jgi:predicted rRNA methylase YqxC with S4 and FtsJ domains
MPSSASSVHRTYRHRLKTLMRSEVYFKSKKKIYIFIQHRKVLQKQLQIQKRSSLTTLLSAEEVELDEEEKDEE